MAGLAKYLPNMLAAAIASTLGGGGAPTWTPAQWFLANEQGIWLDPSDFTRYMAGKGPELVTNGDFATGISSWTANGPSISWSAGRLSYTSAAGGYITIPFSGVVVGKCYEVIVDVVSHASANLRFSLFGSTFIYTAAECTGRTMRHTVIATNTTATLDPYGGSSGLIDNVSIKEVTSINTATMFQNSEGTTPVTAVEQPDGLALDKRLGLVRGSELGWEGTLSPANFTNTTGYTITDLGDRIRITCTSPTGGPILDTPLNVVAGSFHVVSFAILAISSGASGFFSATNGGAEQAIGNTYPPLPNAFQYINRLSGNGNGKLRLSFAPARSASPSNALAGDYIEISKTISVRELPGNHASQATSAARPVLSARKNLLTKTEDFADAAWTKSNVSLSAGTESASKIVTATSALGSIYQLPSVPNAVCTHSIDVRRVSGTGSVTLKLPNNGGAPPLALTSSWQRFSTTLATGGTTGYFVLEFANSGDAVEIRFPQSEAGPTATTYQRVNTATDYDTEGFLHYWKNDGVDDGLATNQFPAGTLGSNMDLFALMRLDAAPTDDAYFADFITATKRYAFALGGAGALTSTGSGVFKVNGLTPVQSRAGVEAAMGLSKWCVLEINNINLADFVSFGVNNYTTHNAPASYAEVILAPAKSAEERTKAREYLAAKAGITL